MSDTSTVPATRNEATDLVTFKIKLSSRPINEEYRIISLYITKSYNKISWAKIVISDGDPAAQDFRISSNEDSLTPGNEIEISIGYHSQVKTVFKGIITKHAIKSAKNKASFLTIEAKDKAVKLSLSRKNNCFVDKTDKDIVEEIIGKSGYGGTLDMSSTTGTHKEMVQYNVSDWDFIVSRAEMNEMLVLTDDNKLLIKKPDTNQEAAKEIVYGTDVIEFDSEIDGGSQLKQITTHAWNYKDQKIDDVVNGQIQFKENGNLKSDDIADSFGIKEYDLCHSGSLESQELKLWSNSKLLKSRMAKNIGRITVKGTTEIKPGQVIKLKGFSKRFNGNVLITGVSHNYSTSIWQTDIHFGLPQQWFYQSADLIEKPAAGLIPGINGLQIGIVLQLENDPNNEHRIKIRLPVVDMGEGLWARIASLDAGSERGSFFRPEINDEVIVGFLNDDPRYPVVLGMLNSSAKPAPINAKDTNHEKGFITRSKIKFIFNDDKKTVTLETPKGKKIEIDDDGDVIIFSDQHHNKLSLNDNGVTIESSKDISLKAASGDIKMEAINIDNKANGKFSAKGNTQAELQSSGQTTVKGAIVNIN
jgi:Rhs element Vgr protein